MPTTSVSPQSVLRPDPPKVGYKENNILAGERPAFVDDIFLSYYKSVDDDPRSYEKRFKRYRSFDNVFRPRQGLGNINNMVSMAANAFKIVSLIMGVLRGGGNNAPVEEPVSEPTDRVDVIPPKDNLDVAMGTLMAFGGKYLRQTAIWIFEQATAREDVINEKVGGSVGFLEKLSAEELEKVAASAVQNGADPTTLQEAFVTAQTSGDWTDLENEIASVLGPEAVGGSPIGGALNNPLSGISSTFGQAVNAIKNVISSPSPNQVTNEVDSIQSDSESTSTSVVPPEGGPMYYLYVAQDYVNRFDKVVNAEPTTTDAENESLILRLIKEFKLENQALSIQTRVNSVISSINNFLGEPDPISNKVESTSPDNEGYSEIPSLMSSIPNMIGNFFSSIFSIFSSGASPPQNKIRGINDLSSNSESRPSVPSTLVGVLGSVALGTVALGFLASNSGAAQRKLAYEEYISKTPSLNPEDFQFSGGNTYNDEHVNEIAPDVPSDNVNPYPYYLPSSTGYGNTNEYYDTDTAETNSDKYYYSYY